VPGRYGNKETGISDDACFASLWEVCRICHKNPDDRVGFWTLYNGGVDRRVTEADHKCAPHMFDGRTYHETETSLEWRKYVLGDQSPWKLLHPHIHEKCFDLDWKENFGLIIEDIRPVPISLLFNFLQAFRRPFEYYTMLPAWMRWKDIYGPRAADWLSCSLTKDRYLKGGHAGPNWFVTTAYSGHCHLHKSEPMEYGSRFLKAEPDPAFLTQVFGELHDRKLNNSNMWLRKVRGLPKVGDLLKEEAIPQLIEKVTQ
jgi:hypothetical protein